jgi:DNA-binding NarL/FixJ family response regulator
MANSASAAIRVVLADDDGTFVTSLRELIDSQPELEVVGTAADGLEAIEVVDALAPDAVVVDLHMPLLDGVTAVARLRHDHPRVCLIALTGDQAPELHRAVRDAGADAVLVKGAIVDALVERLSHAKEASPTAPQRS